MSGNAHKTMTLITGKKEELNADEWNELNALRLAINYNPASVHPEKLERFSELFVRTLDGKGDTQRNSQGIF